MNILSLGGAILASAFSISLAQPRQASTTIINLDGANTYVFGFDYSEYNLTDEFHHALSSTNHKAYFNWSYIYRVSDNSLKSYVSDVSNADVNDVMTEINDLFAFTFANVDIGVITYNTSTQLFSCDIHRYIMTTSLVADGYLPIFNLFYDSTDFDSWNIYPCWLDYSTDNYAFDNTDVVYSSSNDDLSQIFTSKYFVPNSISGESPLPIYNYCLRLHFNDFYSSYSSLRCSYELDIGIENNYYQGYSDGYNAGYWNGYEIGGNDGFADGRADGYADGYSAGNADGYQNGYNAGLEVHNPYTFGALFGAIADTPILIVRNLLNFDFFGVNLMSVVLTLFTALILFYLLRKIL